MSSPEYSPDVTNTNSPQNSPPPSDEVAGYDLEFLGQILPPSAREPDPPLFVAEGPPPSDYNFLNTVLNPLDNILNPARLDHGRYSPFTYRASPPRQRFPQPDRQAYNSTPPRSMAPSTHSRPGRLSNGYVDLTSSDPPPVPRKRDAPSSGPSSKRQKRNDGTSQRRGGSSSSSTTQTIVENVDLTADDTHPVSSVLQKQREDAVKSQTQSAPNEKPTTFNTFTCVICMDVPTDLTATACGHLFCHTCLMEALIAGENRTGPGEPKRSQCPVCRKSISRTKTTDIIPLLLLKQGAPGQPTRKRRELRVLG